MKKVDKYKFERYKVSMKIIELESKKNASKLSVNEEKELIFLKNKEADYNQKIDKLTEH